MKEQREEVVFVPPKDWDQTVGDRTTEKYTERAGPTRKRQPLAGMLPQAENKGEIDSSCFLPLSL